MADSGEHSRERVCDWQEELVRIAPELPTLPKAARDLVLDLLAHFAAEDAELEPGAEGILVPLHAAAA